MGKVMSKEKDARDIALKEYDEFMDKYKDHVEAGDMKLMQHMLRLESNKIRTQEVYDVVDKSSAIISKSVYDLDEYKMKLQMSKEEYSKDQNQEEPSMISIGDPDDTYKVDSLDFGQVAPVPAPALKKEEERKTFKQTSAVEIDKKTGKKVYKGPKLRSRKIVDGKVWDSSHPNFHDKGVGGM